MKNALDDFYCHSWYNIPYDPMCKRCACMYVRMCAYKLLREAWTKCRRCNTRTPPLTNPSSWTIECHYASIHRESSSSMISHKKKKCICRRNMRSAAWVHPLLSPAPPVRCVFYNWKRRGEAESDVDNTFAAEFISRNTHTHTHTLCSKQVPRVCRITFYRIADTC